MHGVAAVSMVRPMSPWLVATMAVTVPWPAPLPRERRPPSPLLPVGGKSQDAVSPLASVVDSSLDSLVESDAVSAGSSFSEPQPARNRTNRQATMAADRFSMAPIVTSATPYADSAA